MKKLVIMMSILLGGVACKSGYPTDTVTVANGEELKIEFFAHASIAFEWQGKHIYVDPVSTSADYSKLPKADFIVVTHEHSDHFDKAAIKALSSSITVVICPQTVRDELGYGDVMPHGQTWVIYRDVTLSAVPAYNTSPEKLAFHPKDALNNGYIFTFGGTRIYVAGDTEQTPEMSDLTGIDIAFLPVNLPYTMTEEQAAMAVKTLRPKIFYPYHTGLTDHKTDLRKLKKLLEDTRTEVRVHPMK